MKKSITAALATLLVLLAGCGQAPPAGGGAPSPQQPPLTEDRALLALRQDLLQGDGTSYSFDIWGGEPLFDNMYVRMDAALFETVADALTRTAAEKAGQVQNFSSTDSREEIMIQGGVDQTVCLQIFQLDEAYTEPAVNRTMVWLQLGEEMYHYYFAPEVFGTIREAVAQRYTQNHVEVTGTYTPAALSAETPKDSFIQAVVESGGRMGILHSWVPNPNRNGYTAALELLDTATGQSVAWLDLGRDAFRFEACSYEGYDMRVLFRDGGALYLSAADPARQLEVSLEEEQLAIMETVGLMAQSGPVRAEFDIDPENGVCAVVTPEGVQLAAGGQTTLLANTLLTPQQLGNRYPTGAVEEFLPRLGAPRIMNGGKALVCTIVVPGSQIGECGLVVHDIATGQNHWHPDLFTLPWYTVGYPGNAVVAVANEERTTLIDLATGQAAYAATPEGFDHGATVDFKHYVFTGQQRLPDGGGLTVLHTGNVDDPLVSVTGGDRPMYVEAMGQSHVLCRVAGGQGTEYMLVRYL